MDIISLQDGVATVAVSDEAALNSALRTLFAPSSTHRRVYVHVEGRPKYAGNKEVDGWHLYQLPEPTPRGGRQLVDRILNSLQQGADTYSVHELLMEYLANSDEQTRQFGRKLIRSLRLNEGPGMR